MARLHLLSLSLGDNWPLIFTFAENKQAGKTRESSLLLSGGEGGIRTLGRV